MELWEYPVTTIIELCILSHHSYGVVGVSCHVCCTVMSILMHHCCTWCFLSLQQPLTKHAFFHHCNHAMAMNTVIVNSPFIYSGMSINRHLLIAATSLVRTHCCVLIAISVNPNTMAPSEIRTPFYSVLLPHK